MTGQDRLSHAANQILILRSADGWRILGTSTRPWTVPSGGEESSGQLLRHIDPSARFFAVFDAISGFHQVSVDPESSKLLNITTQMGNYRYTVLGQGLCCSQDLFNYITRGSTQTDPTFKIIKNVDDFCLYGNTIEELEHQIKKLMKMCSDINLKLSPSKFKLSFGWSI